MTENSGDVIISPPVVDIKTILIKNLAVFHPEGLVKEKRLGSVAI